MRQFLFRRIWGPSGAFFHLFSPSLRSFLPETVASILLIAPPHDFLSCLALDCLLLFLSNTPQAPVFNNTRNRLLNRRSHDLEDKNSFTKLAAIKDIEKLSFSKHQTRYITLTLDRFRSAWLSRNIGPAVINGVNSDDSKSRNHSGTTRGFGTNRAAFGRTKLERDCARLKS